MGEFSDGKFVKNIAQSLLARGALKNVVKSGYVKKRLNASQVQGVE